MHAPANSTDGVSTSLLHPVSLVEEPVQYMKPHSLSILQIFTPRAFERCCCAQIPWFLAFAARGHLGFWLLQCAVTLVSGFCSARSPWFLSELAWNSGVPQLDLGILNTKDPLLIARQVFEQSVQVYTCFTLTLMHVLDRPQPQQHRRSRVAHKLVLVCRKHVRNWVSVSLLT